jgi:hypothetical protein
VSKATGQFLNFYEIYGKKWTHFDELMFPQKKQRGRNILTGNHVDSPYCKNAKIFVFASGPFFIQVI